MLAFLALATLALVIAALFTSTRHSYRSRAVSENAESEDDRFNRAQALMLAAIAWKGDPASCNDIMALADEFLKYIEGASATMPRADQILKGTMPKP